MKKNFRPVTNVVNFQMDTTKMKFKPIAINAAIITKVSEIVVNTEVENSSRVSLTSASIFFDKQHEAATE